MKDISVFFFNSQKRLSLLHAQVDDKCPDFSRSPLKDNCSTKWIENCDVVFVFNEFYPAVGVLLINCQNQEMERLLEGLCLT